MENGTGTNPETAANGQVENNTNAQLSTQNQPQVQPMEDVASLKKAREQAEMRANQLANELKKKEEALAAREKAEEEARQKQLEENEEFKTLYERSQERIKEIESEREKETVSNDIKNFKSDTLSKYPESVIELATSTGIDLFDNSDEAKEAYTKKLDVIAEKLNSGKKVTGNNVPVNNETVINAQLIGSLRNGNAATRKQAANSIIGNMSFIKEMKKQAE